MGLVDVKVSLLLDNSHEGQINSYQRTLCRSGSVLAIINATVQKKGETPVTVIPRHIRYVPICDLDD